MELMADNRIWFGTRGNSRPRLKKFLTEAEGTTAWTWWPNTEVGHNQEATKELSEVLGVASQFDNPKPVRLISRILQLASDRQSIVLDSFAGSGTTGHAVLSLNKEDGGSRRFILVEMEPEVCRRVTAERLRRVVGGYSSEGGASIPGFGGGFRYCELGPTLFDTEGRIRAEVSFRELAQHVYFTETGEPLPTTKNGKSPLLGSHYGMAVYLLYNGILKDTSPDGGNVLTRQVLGLLPPHDGPKVIYGTASRLSPGRLRQLGIVFRQIPYEIRVR
jgi:site-specific DNA-methyltransferase (adenine-specific)/adenine-specific DNA-methyltransferase